jgi:hypothetical protein
MDTDKATSGELFIEEYRRHLAASLETVRHCLRQLNDQQLWWRPQRSQNSIANLTLHLCGNLRQRILSLVGGEPDVRNRGLEFTERGPIPQPELLRRLDDIAGAVDATLVGLPPARLSEQQLFRGAAAPIEESLLGGLLRTLAHLGGHAQEIVCLTRMQLKEAYTFRGAPPPPEMLDTRDRAPS